MKKIIILAAIALLCASMVFAFTKKDLAGLKGTWEGMASTGSGANCNFKLEIMNDAEPLQGKITLTNIPPQAKVDYGMQDPTVVEGSDGKLTSTGTIMFTGPTGFFEITGLKDKKLSAWFFSKGVKGTVSATKK